MFVSDLRLDPGELHFFSGFVAGSRRFTPANHLEVARGRDCLKIVDILNRFPPLGKAGRQFEVWRRAVQLWAGNGQQPDELSAMAAELGTLHRSAEPVPCRVDITPEEVGRFLAGFASAEAHFGASPRGSPRFVINLRADDGPLLALFQEAFGLGYLRDIPASGTSRAAVTWRLGRLMDLQALVTLLEASPPRGRAGYVYRAWRELVRTPLRTSLVKRAFAIEIRRRRDFVADVAGVERVPLIDRRRARCAAALREWSLSTNYPGGSTAYERWRRRSRRGAPTRNTIAAAYGSWLDALETLGLDTSGAHDLQRVQTIRAGVTPPTSAGGPSPARPSSRRSGGASPSWGASPGRPSSFAGARSTRRRARRR